MTRVWHREEATHQDDASVPDWSPVPDQPPASPRVAIARRAVGALLAIALLVWLGHRSVAAVLLAVMAVLTLISARSSAVANRMDRVEHTIRRVAGQGLTVVLMGVVQLLVFVPLWIVLRLFRHDPLAHGQSTADSTFWRPHPERAGRPLHRRPFAYERYPKSGLGASRALRLRAAIGLVVLIALADVGLGAVIEQLQGDPASQSATALTGENPPAGEGEHWRTVLPEVTLALERKSYDPFLGFRVVDFDGTYVNVKDGIRQSHQATAALSPEAVTVFFFGGSAMFGAFQRDGHTIPSEFARLAEADDIPVRVVNYGQPAYVNWQEMLLLQSLVAGGERPDIAVCYDGFNELLSQFSLGEHSDPAHLQTRVMQERLASGAGIEDNSFFKRAYKTWAETSALHRLGRALGVVPELDEDLGPLQSPFEGDQSDHPGRRAMKAVSIYSRGVDVATRLAKSYGFRVAYFWQPSVYSRRLVKEEEPLASAAGYDADAWRTATRVARSRLAAPVVDMSEVLDGIRKPVMYDVVHTNEKGARTVATALYRQLRPELQRLAAAKRR